MTATSSLFTGPSLGMWAKRSLFCAEPLSIQLRGTQLHWKSDSCNFFSWKICSRHCVMLSQSLPKQPDDYSLGLLTVDFTDNVILAIPPVATWSAFLFAEGSWRMSTSSSPWHSAWPRRCEAVAYNGRPFLCCNPLHKHVIMRRDGDNIKEAEFIKLREIWSASNTLIWQDFTPGDILKALVNYANVFKLEYIVNLVKSRI